LPPKARRDLADEPLRNASSTRAATRSGFFAGYRSRMRVPTVSSRSSVKGVSRTCGALRLSKRVSSLKFTCTRW
jgi:hypothetical protein